MKVLLFASLASVGLFSSYGATLVNDFSGVVTGYEFTDSGANYYSMSSPSASPNATSAPGQVDQGFYTVNYRDMPFFNVGQIGIVNAYTGAMGSWSAGTGYTGGTYFDLADVTGFLVSLRREAMNDAETINLYILSNQDTEYYFPINLAALPTNTFSDVLIDLTTAVNYSYFSGLGATQIGIKGDMGNPSSTYNFSVDSLRVQTVPEPSSGLLLLSGLGSLAVLRRRFR